MPVKLSSVLRSLAGDFDKTETGPLAEKSGFAYPDGIVKDLNCLC